MVTENLISQFWGGSKNSKKAKQLKNLVWCIVNKKMPPWAKKFEDFISSLNQTQKLVINAEYFYSEEEKPSQRELAKKLSMTGDNYKYHLKQAVKALEAFYPEYSRVSRRNDLRAAPKPHVKPKPLFKLIDGDKIEIPQPKRQLRIVSNQERELIKEWAYKGEQTRLYNVNKDKRRSAPTITEQYDRLFEKVQVADL